MAENIISNAQNLHEIRREYVSDQLNNQDIPDNPLQLFDTWFQLIKESDILDPSAATLSTVSPSNKPTSRIILVKEVSENGYVFYTNYDSQKAKDLELNPNASLLFYWDSSHKQVRIEGQISKVPRAQSEAYFNSRPIESQRAGILSPQSQTITSREELLEDYQKLENQDTLSCPDNWGGYILKPERYEFWQGREFRLHDRITYTRTQKGNWKIERLAP